MSDDRTPDVERRERAAELVADALERRNDTENVKAVGDRVTLMLDNGDAITLIVADARPRCPDDLDACPFCGSSRLRQSENASDTFRPRRGCLDCNRWIDPVRLK